MRIFTLSLFITVALLTTSAPAQIQNHASTTENAPPKQHAPSEINLDPKVAETLLVHKEQPSCGKDIDGVLIKATIVIAVTIDKDGEVSHARTLSGPKIMRPLALATVRKYRYRPFLLNNKPVEFQTEVPIQIDCVFRNGQA